VPLDGKCGISAVNNGSSSRQREQWSCKVPARALLLREELLLAYADISCNMQPASEAADDEVKPVKAYC
jgi:hypothetical protein